VTTVPLPICYSCVHLTAVEYEMTCAAYPDGIPTEILESVVDHRLPYAGDGGIQFTQNPARSAPDLTVFEGEPP
jgi:hypothetical protein